MTGRDKLVDDDEPDDHDMVYKDGLVSSVWGGAASNPSIMIPKSELSNTHSTSRALASEQTFIRLQKHRTNKEVMDEASDDGSDDVISQPIYANKYKFNQIQHHPQSIDAKMYPISCKTQIKHKLVTDDGWDNVPCPIQYSVYKQHPSDPRERKQYIQKLAQMMIDRHSEYKLQDDKTNYYARKYRYSYQQDDENIQDDY
jgi:protein tyrosine/serine phosphatase